MPLLKSGLVLGGAASGKSAHAEGLLRATGRPLAYVATAQARDDEMRDKAARHRAQRGPGWRTIEAPLDVAGALDALPGEEAALVDCATLWLSNLMLGGHEVEGATEALLAAIARRAAPVVVVSNEVGLGIVPDTPLGRAFREAQGRLNQRLAAEADLVVLVVAGLPLVLRGRP